MRLLREKAADLKDAFRNFPGFGKEDKVDREILLKRLTDSQGGLPELWSEGESWMIYQPRFVRDLSFEELDAEIAWKQDEMKIYGKPVLLPRLTGWYGDPGTDYIYSGIYNQALPWTPSLESLRNRLREDLGLEFNAMLANRYADGSQHMGYHADSEPEFGEAPVIVSLSFGAARGFLWKRKGKGEKAQRWDLEDRSLLVMGGAMQREFVHAVAKTSLPLGPRINLTFRRVLA